MSAFRSPASALGSATLPAPTPRTAVFLPAAFRGGLFGHSGVWWWLSLQLQTASAPSPRSQGHRCPRAAPLRDPQPVLQVPITLPSKLGSEAPCSQSAGRARSGRGARPSLTRALLAAPSLCPSCSWGETSEFRAFAGALLSDLGLAVARLAAMDFSIVLWTYRTS